MYKYTIGLDWAKTKSTVCVLSEQGTSIYRGDILCGGEGVRWLVKRLSIQSQEALIVSEVGPASISIQEACDELGVEHHPVHAKHIALIVKTRKKSDRIDAFKLAEQGFKDNLPRRVMVPSRETSRNREYVYQRSKLIGHRTSLLNEIRWIYFNNVQVFLGEGKLMKSQMISKIKREKILNNITDTAIRKTVSTRFNMVDMLSETIEEIEAAMRPKDKDQQKREERLRTIPGVGPIVSQTYTAVIGDVRRFKNIREVVSYAGLAPGFYQSGAKNIGLRITKEGNKYLRTVLVQSAQTILRVGKPGDPLLDFYFKKRARKKSHNKVIVALAAKILKIMYAVDQKKKEYDPKMLGEEKVIQSAA